MSKVTGSRIVSPIKGRVEVEQFELGEVGGGDILARSVCSLISTGTELTALHGAFDLGTHWDRWVRYPFQQGYSVIARVEEVDRGVIHAGYDSHIPDEPAGPNYALFLREILSKRIDVKPLNTDCFDPTDCALAYEMASSRRDQTIGILFERECAA